jgi:hypothetical protein
MRTVRTQPPSFPDVPPNRPLDLPVGQRWHVVCGDAGRWRVGLYSPTKAAPEEIGELERHDCPELFVLLEGRVSLLLVEDGAPRVLELEPGRPVLVTAPHSGFCPDGPGTGSALVVERDAFRTDYDTVADWLRAAAGPTR